MARSKASASTEKSQSGTPGKRPTASQAQSRRASGKANTVAEIIEPCTSDEDAATASAAAKPGRTERSGRAQATGNRVKRKQGVAASRTGRGPKTQKRGATTLPETEVEPTSDDGAGKVGGQGNGSASIDKGGDGAANTVKVRDTVPPQWLFYVADLGTTKEEGREEWDKLDDEAKAEQRRKHTGTRLPNVDHFKKKIAALGDADLRAKFADKEWKATANNGRRAIWTEARFTVPDPPLTAKAKTTARPTRLAGINPGGEPSPKVKKGKRPRKRAPPDAAAHAESLDTHAQRSAQVHQCIATAARQVELANLCAAKMGGPPTTVVLTFIGADEAAGPGFNKERLRTDFSGNPAEQRITVLGAADTVHEALGRAAMALAVESVRHSAPCQSFAENDLDSTSVAVAEVDTPVETSLKEDGTSWAGTDRLGFTVTANASKFTSRTSHDAPGDDRHDTRVAQQVADIASVASAAPTAVASSVAGATLSQVPGHLSDSSAAHSQGPQTREQLVVPRSMSTRSQSQMSGSEDSMLSM